MEVGEYIRSTDGYIGKVIEIRKSKRECDTYYVTDKTMASGYYEHIKAHSKNIIDLIEVGDYVNGYEVMNIYKPRDIWEPIEIEIDSKCTRCFLASEIKSIVTKEQFKEMEFSI